MGSQVFEYELSVSPGLAPSPLEILTFLAADSCSCLLGFDACRRMNLFTAVTSLDCCIELPPAGCLNQQTFVSHSFREMCKAEVPADGGLLRAHFRVWRCPLLVASRGGEQREAASCILPLLRALILPGGLLPHYLITSQRPHLQISSH